MADTSFMRDAIILSVKAFAAAALNAEPENGNRRVGDAMRAGSPTLGSPFPQIQG